MGVLTDTELRADDPGSRNLWQWLQEVAGGYQIPDGQGPTRGDVIYDDAVSGRVYPPSEEQRQGSPLGPRRLGKYDTETPTPDAPQPPVQVDDGSAAIAAALRSMGGGAKMPNAPSMDAVKQALLNKAGITKRQAEAGYVPEATNLEGDWETARGKIQKGEVNPYGESLSRAILKASMDTLAGGGDIRKGFGSFGNEYGTRMDASKAEAKEDYKQKLADLATKFGYKEKDLTRKGAIGEATARKNQAVIGSELIPEAFAGEEFKVLENRYGRAQDIAAADNRAARSGALSAALSKASRPTQMQLVQEYVQMQQKFGDKRPPNEIAQAYIRKEREAKPFEPDMKVAQERASQIVSAGKGSAEKVDPGQALLQAVEEQRRAMAGQMPVQPQNVVNPFQRK